MSDKKPEVEAEVVEAMTMGVFTVEDGRVVTDPETTRWLTAQKAQE